MRPQAGVLRGVVVRERHAGWLAGAGSHPWRSAALAVWWMTYIWEKQQQERRVSSSSW